MEFFHKLIDLLRHLGEDEKWRAMLNFIGLYKLYVVLFAIVFCETGLVILPFLPGDSLLFAVGAVAGRDIGIPLLVVGPMLIIAALLGDNVNYWLGRRVGPKVFSSETSRLLNRKHLLEAQHFYEKYGHKTIILARFVPIIRTFAPFVAGIGKMRYVEFLLFSVVGAVVWVCACLSAGYYFGSFPFVKKHFELIILAIIFISVLPAIFEVLKARSKSAAALQVREPQMDRTT